MAHCNLRLRIVDAGSQKAFEGPISGPGVCFEEEVPRGFKFDAIAVLQSHPSQTFEKCHMAIRHMNRNGREIFVLPFVATNVNIHFGGRDHRVTGFVDSTPEELLGHSIEAAPGRGGPGGS